MPSTFEDALLPGVRPDLVRAAYGSAPGNEIESGKFLSPESSAALAANAFGFFLDRPSDLPPLPGLMEHWPATALSLEAIVRFPWSGGRHPCLDALVATSTALIGIESKRYEPYRPKAPGKLSDAYWRPVWGDRMRGFETVRDTLRDGSLKFQRLDAAQLVKHAFGLRTAVQSGAAYGGRKAILFYLYAEPRSWAGGALVPEQDKALHRAEIQRFAEIVAADEVRFMAASYSELLAAWSAASSHSVRSHAEMLAAQFDF